MRKHKYYIFDCDDNLLHLDTVTTVVDRRSGRKMRWTSEDYARIKEKGDFDLYEPIDGDWSKSYKEFGDAHNPEGINRFRRDIARVLRDKGETCHGPSIEAFRKCIREGHLFGILTARGHEEETLRDGVKELILRVCGYHDVQRGFREFHHMYMAETGEHGRLLQDLDTHREEYYTDNVRHLTRVDARRDAAEYDLMCGALDVYLGKCVFVGISSPSFMSAHGMDHLAANMTGKQVAIHSIIDHFIALTREGLRSAAPISIGFSDDDLVNQRTVKDKIVDELLHTYPDVKFCLYKTHGRGYTKEVLHNPH